MNALQALWPLLEAAEESLFLAVAVFLRIGGAFALLPGFGERSLPMRVKLAGAILFTLAIWPAVAPRAPVLPDGPAALTLILLGEAVAGLILGLAVRLLIHGLMTAGAVIAQSTSVSQMMGAGVTAELQPSVANLFAIAGIALALAAGLHVKAAAMLALSYDLLPFGLRPGGADIALWGVAQVARAFALAISLAAPFLVAALLYNVALGALNRAMPQLMVAMVGAPALTGGALILLYLLAPLALKLWLGQMDATLAAPLEAR